MKKMVNSLNVCFLNEKAKVLVIVVIIALNIAYLFALDDCNKKEFSLASPASCPTVESVCEDWTAASCGGLTKSYSLGSGPSNDKCTEPGNDVYAHCIVDATYKCTQKYNCKAGAGSACVKGEALSPESFGFMDEATSPSCRVSS